MSERQTEYQSGATVAQRAPIYIDINKDPRARNQAYLNLYASRVGAQVIAVDIVNGTTLASSNVDLLNGLSGAGNGDPGTGTSGVTEKEPGYISALPPEKIPPSPVTNLVATRDKEDIVLTFDWDYNDPSNYYIERFIVEIRDSSNSTFYFLNGGYGFTPSFINQSSPSQTLRLTSSDLNKTGIELISNIDLVGIATADVLNKGEFVTASVAAFVSPLPQPVFTLSKGTDYYIVTLDPTNLATAKLNGFYGFIIEEQVTTETVKANVSLTNGWVQASPETATTPSTVYAPDDLHRWVRVKYISKNGLPSVYSDIADITPDSFIPVNTNPPTQFTSASIAWSGNDIVVTFAQPSSNAGTTVRVKLVPYINGSESSSLYSYYSHLIVGSQTSFTIKSLDLYNQFGTYYSKFKGYITSLSSQGIETTGAVISSGPVTRSSNLSSVYPTLGTPNVNSPSGIFRVTPISNGYVVDFDLPEGASRLEVYEKSSAWTQVPTDDSLMVYSGLSPATVITPDNTKRYVIVRFYDNYDNTSYYSMEKVGQTSGYEVTPLDVGRLSLIDNPIKIQTDGSIFSGAGDETVYPQVFFNKDGLFAYDDSGNWTTEIINNAAANEPTFITKRATIGDWTISPTAIQNDGYVSGSTYTGLSASGTYSFWAGSATSGGDAQAKFSVTPSGKISARDIAIYGSGDIADTLISAGSYFSVKGDGSVVASKAEITGKLIVDQQSYFNANVNISSGSYLISTGTGTMKVGAEGLLALNSSSSPTTKIYSSPITVSGVSGISLWSSKALFGPNESSGWLIDSGIIKSNYITLDSANQEIKILSSTSNSTNGISLKAGSDTSYAIQAGKLTGTPTSSEAYFYVTHAGSLYAQNAQIAGTLKGGSKTGVGDQTHSGYFFDNAGTAIIGGEGSTQPQAMFTADGIVIKANDERSKVYSPNQQSTVENYTYTCPSGYSWDGQTCSQYITGVGYVYANYTSRTLIDGAVLDSGYLGASKIQLTPSGVYITGLPVQGNADVNHSYWHSVYVNTSHAYGYLNVAGFGPVPRQRAVVEDPVTGVVKLGFAVYYQDSSVYGTVAAPPYTAGLVGDLWVQY